MARSEPRKRVRLEEAVGTVEEIRGRVALVRWDTGARSPVPFAWLSDAPGCQECGAAMEAERSTRRYCSDTCRVRAFRGNAKRRPTQTTSEAPNVRERVERHGKRAA